MSSEHELWRLLDLMSMNRRAQRTALISSKAQKNLYGDLEQVDVFGSPHSYGQRIQAPDITRSLTEAQDHKLSLL
jgi:hypothetical protein